MGQKSIILVDDHELVLEGLKLILQSFEDINCIATFTSGTALLAALPDLEVDCIILDINMEGMNGIETCIRVKQYDSFIKVLALTMHNNHSIIKKMMVHADGYLLKNNGKSQIKLAIDTVLEGKKYVGEFSSEILSNEASITSNQYVKNIELPALTRREKEVLKLILDEQTTQEIATTLAIGFGTVESHRRNIMTKLGCKNTAGLVKTAIEYQLV